MGSVASDSAVYLLYGKKEWLRRGGEGSVRLKLICNVLKMCACAVLGNRPLVCLINCVQSR